MNIEPIAIVGVSCRLPGNANDLSSLWSLLGDGGEAWSPVPPDRFNETAFHHPDTNDPNGTTNHRGGHFINGDVRDFDHAFFRISPSLAAAMDPQQRILLELSYEALESAGWARETLAGSRTAVYAAIFGYDYERNLCKDVLDMPVYQSVGTGIAILANRISHTFDLRGPSVTLDTGCSGGLVALHHACQTLRNGESEMALVASANLQLMPDHYIGMSAQNMVNSHGRCYPFDVRGKGYGRGEGFVVVVLKRLGDAIRDGDPIRSVILNTGVNQDGFTASGITHPNHVAQADLIRRTYANALLRPEDVVYIEAHGTGTVAGDQQELRAIADVFVTSNRVLPLYIGSNKGSIGHTESTSGLASLLKAMCILDHDAIPPVAGFSTPKPGLPLDRIQIPTARLPWPKDVAPRISINSFGYGGTNAHAIVEKGPPVDREHCRRKSLSSYHLFAFSANSQASLKSMLKKYARWVETNPDISLIDLSHTLFHGRSELQWRFSCIAQSSTALVQELQTGLNKVTSKPTLSTRDLIFVFSGQGAQWATMGRELLVGTTSKFSSSIQMSRDILCELGATWDLEVELLRPDEDSNINTAEFAQPATTAIQIALVDLLRAQGVRPAIVIGHSSGEIGAAYAAGRISRRTALNVSFHRGFMAAAAVQRGLPCGAMASIGLSASDTAPQLEGLFRGKAVIACINSPNSVTISGDADAIDEAVANIMNSGDNIFQRRLRTDTAYHSHHMSAVADEYRARLADLDVFEEGVSALINEDDTEVVFVSSVTGLPWVSKFDASYWVDNLVSRVNFLDAIRTTTQEHQKRGGHAIFIEIGPHPALAGPVRQCLSSLDKPILEYDYLSTLKRGVNAISSTLELTGRLFERGIKLKPAEVLALTPSADKAVLLPNLPTYPWDHSMKHWHESRLSREYRMRHEPYHDLLGVRIPGTPSVEPRWRHMISSSTLPWLADHVIDGLAIFPGAGYVCMAAEAVMQLAREQCLEPEFLAFRDVSFIRGLVVPKSPQRIEMQLSLRQQSDGTSLHFSFSVSALSEGTWNEQCTGYIKAIFARCSDESDPVGIKVSPCHATGNDLSGPEVYEEMATDGNTYGPAFRGLRFIRMAADGTKATAVVEVPDIAPTMPARHQSRHLLHPTTFDSMFHVGIPMIKQQHGAGSVMPVHISDLLISTRNPDLNSPGSELQVDAKITSQHFRTTHIDMNVTARGFPVLSASGIESRSLVAHAQNSDESICYELDWRPDVEFLRACDLPANPSFANLVSLLCFKSTALSIAELGAGLGDLSSTVIDTMSAYDRAITTYEFIDTTSNLFHAARERLSGYSVSFRVLDPVNDIQLEGLEPHAYNIVLTSDTVWLTQASVLLKANGFLIVVFKSSSVYDEWRAESSETCPTLDTQLTFVDATNESMIVLMRSIREPPFQIPSQIRMLTHSAIQDTSYGVGTLKAGLQAMGATVSVETLNQAFNERRSEPKDGDCFIVVDDMPQPILSDPNSFEAAIALFRQTSKILWLSPDSPLAMHQITGVARTAHAENDNLRVTTVHVASDALQNPRLSSIVGRLWDKLVDRDQLHEEREYALSEDAMVLIPRLSYSDSLNHVVSAEKEISSVEIKMNAFIDSGRPICLSTAIPSRSGQVLFVNDQAMVLADDAIEIETEAFVLSRSSNSTLYSGEYAGIVRSVGKHVTNLVSGDAVIALCLDKVVGHSRLVIPYYHAIRRPERLSPATASSLLLPTLAAVHVLQDLAHNLEVQTNLLVHGALSDLGRATIATAQTFGANIVTTAADSDEALEIIQILDIPAQNVIINRPSLTRSSFKVTMSLDIIVIASRDPLPNSSLTLLKPFGRIVSFSPSCPINISPKLHRNVTVHYTNIWELLQERTDLVANLMEKAGVVLQRVSINSLKYVIQNVSRAEEAIRQINLGICDKVVIQANPTSLVRIATPPVMNHAWSNLNASYIIAGGMGDLGRRFLILLAKRGAQHLITISRRTIDPQERQAFERELQGINPVCRLYCLKCDVTSEHDVYEVSDTIARLGVPPVRGIIQSAAYLQDRTLENMTFDTFLPVTLAKVQGTLNLEKVFATPHLDFFLTLSSAVVVTGASGQANYNAGNAVQDALAHHRPPGFISLNIGWIEDAVHTANDKTKLQGLWRTGLRPISPLELSRYFDYILGAASSHSDIRQAVIGFNKASLAHTSAGNSNVQSALFCHVRGAQTVDKASSSATRTLSFKDVIESGDFEATVDFISRAIIGQLGVLISVNASQVNARNDSIMGLGIDSLVAIELRNWITREFEASLQSSEIITDLPLRDLSQKVASRSRLLLATRESSVEERDNKTTDALLTNLTSHPTSTSSTVVKTPFKLPPLPLDSLEDFLDLFKQSRYAIDSPGDYAETTAAVRALIEGPGFELLQQIQETDPDRIADNYERQVYLERREPLPETGQFTFSHPMNAPQHSQAERAAIVTLAAIRFARHLSEGKIPMDTLNGEPLSTYGRDWLFYATRLPGSGVDKIQTFAPNDTIAVIRRGHVFELRLPKTDQDLDLQRLHSTYLEIVKISELQVLPVCTLTADERDSWALYRHELEHNPENIAVLNCLDTAAFVLCLDDESPTSAGQRYTCFLLNSQDRPFANRWLDKTFQLAVTANGLSTEIYEHTKLDGLDTRALHAYLCQAILSQQVIEPMGTDTALHHTASYPVKEHVWKASSPVAKRIEHVWNMCRSYGPLEYQTLDASSFGLASLRGTRSPPNATAHVAILLALYLVDGEIRAAWEKVTLGTFARGRVEWVQTVSPAMRDFIIAASSDNHDKALVRTLLDSATSAHSRNIAAASRGHGAVGHLYAIRGAAQERQGAQLPKLFQTKAWDATRRGGPGQDIKIGFMRSSPVDQGDESTTVGATTAVIHPGEGGFLVPGERGIYIHSNVHETHAHFSLSGKPEYVTKVHGSLEQAVRIIKELLNQS
ncbi:polyketide synthase [Xylaria sp. FL1777]|nr:polyketide synthase [Xylaria sp. FL1777]